MTTRSLSGKLLVAAAVVLCTVGAAAAAGVQFSLTPSVAPGLYVRTAGRGGAPAVGELVTFCPPASVAAYALDRGYLHRGGCPGGVEPLGKHVLALASDTVAVSAEGVRLNGVPVPNSAVHTHDRLGRRLAHAPFGERVVGPDSFFAFAGRHPRSFDSRYFGPVPLSAVRSTIRPLWTAD